jgi:hypothetical protein
LNITPEQITQRLRDTPTLRGYQNTAPAAAAPAEQPDYAALPAWAPSADVIRGVVTEGLDNPISRTPENIRLAQEYLSRNPIRGLRSLTPANFYMMMIYTGQDHLSLIETLAGSLEISVSEIMGKINP